MKGFGDKLLGSPMHFTFEQRIFNLSILIGIVLTAFGTVMDIIYSGKVEVDIAFLGIWVLTYYFSRSGQYFRVVSIVALAVMVYAFIPYEWILSSGMQGALPYYTIVAILIVSMILRGTPRIVMVVSMLAVEIVLIGYDVSISNMPWSIYISLGIHFLMALAATALLTSVYSNTYSKEKKRSETYALAIEENVRQQYYYMENLEQLIGRLKSERHDFNNHLSVLNGLLESGEADKAKAYAALLVKNAAEYQSIVNVPYPALRALLNHKLSAARDGGIELKLDIGLPEGLQLNEFDLAAILGNLLDNATEACALLTDAAPYIGLVLKYQPDYLVIHIKNPCTAAPESKRRTTKPDPENHGFGLKNVEYLVERHNGIMGIKNQGSVFEVNIALLVE